MSGYERDRDEMAKRADERATERNERNLPDPGRATSGCQSGDAYGCVDWFDYDPEAEPRKLRIAH
jgi:hypothetical protein